MAKLPNTLLDEAATERLVRTHRVNAAAAKLRTVLSQARVQADAARAVQERKLQDTLTLFREAGDALARDPVASRHAQETLARLMDEQAQGQDQRDQFERVVGEYEKELARIVARAVGVRRRRAVRHGAASPDEETPLAEESAAPAESTVPADPPAPEPDDGKKTKKRFRRR